MFLVYSFLALLLFIGGLFWKRDRMMLYSWVWLAATSILAQALSGPEASALVSVASVVYFLVAIDFHQFLHRIRLAKDSHADAASEVSREGWVIMKRRVTMNLAFCSTATAIVLGGFALGGPALMSGNPILIIIGITSLLLILTTLVSSGIGRTV